MNLRKLCADVKWCIMVHHNERGKGKVSRISVTLAKDDYSELARIAKAKKVSIAWVIRDAVDVYLHRETPLLHPRT